MAAGAVEVAVRQVECHKGLHVFAAQRGECVKKCAQRLALRRGKLREAIELLEGSSVAMLEDEFGSWHPVGVLAVNQVADDVERAPGGAALVRGDPVVREPAQQRVEGGRRA